MADKNAARKLAAQIQKRQIQKNFLSREESLDRETLRKLKEKWLEVLLRCKLPEMKENLRNILDYMEKLVEVEVFRKRLFEEERKEFSDQLNIQAQSHSRALDNLFDLYLKRVRDLDELYKEQVRRKKEEAEDEVMKIIEGEKEIEDCLKAILYQMKMNQEKKEDSMKCDMFLKMDDEKSKNAEKSENLRVQLERLMEKRWYQISTVIADYQQSTEHRRNHYAQLITRDKHDSKIIHSQMKKTQKLYIPEFFILNNSFVSLLDKNQIQQFRNSLENTDFTDPKMILIADYREERNKFYNSFVYLKEVIAEEMRQDNMQLKDLTSMSKDTMDYLNNFLKKGEKTLTLFSLCLKLETEKEKVVPVGSTLYTTKTPDYLVRQLNVPEIQELANNVDHDIIKKSMMEEFQNFWKKVGKVQLSIIALSKGISDMELENDMLRKLLHSYFNQITSKV